MEAETLSLDPVLVWAGAILLLVNVATTLWNIFSGPSRRNSAAISTLQVRLDEHGLRVQRIEDRVQQMPDHDAMHRVELAIARMEGHIDRIDERLKPVAAIAERMQEIMLEQARR